MLEKSAIILSGGKSSRMNYINKAFLEMKGESLIEIIIKRVSVFNEILIVSNNPEEYEQLGVKVITDIIPNCGPLSGIHAGLSHSQYHDCLVIPCDMPFITPEILMYMASLTKEFDIVVPKINNEFQPLCGIYSKNCIDPIATCLQKNIYKIINMYPMVRVRQVVEQEIRMFGEPEALFRNINNPKEYLEFCEGKE